MHIMPLPNWKVHKIGITSSCVALVFPISCPTLPQIFLTLPVLLLRLRPVWLGELSELTKKWTTGGTNLRQYMLLWMQPMPLMLVDLLFLLQGSGCGSWKIHWDAPVTLSNAEKLFGILGEYSELGVPSQMSDLPTFFPLACNAHLDSIGRKMTHLWQTSLCLPLS